ncbi:MAG: hypothetical protein IPK82_13810 [Polyangiaceae bacterium]|nr:hypothetical protein [Polyangiaceae bacterium]
MAYFQPVSSGIWGVYDSATFYLADELVPMVHAGAGSGATAHEIMFGTLFQGGGDFESVDLAKPLQNLLLPGEAGASPLLAISRVKLCDPLLAACGSTLKAAFASFAAREASLVGVECLIMQCRSTYEMAIIGMADNGTPLQKYLRILQSTTVRALTEKEPHLSRVIDCALERKHNITLPNDILRRWVRGRWSSPNSSVELVRSSLLETHVVMSQRDQLGMRRGCTSALASVHAESVRQVCNWGLAERRQDRPTIDAKQFATELASLEKDGTLVATVQWFPKAGHADPVIAEVARIASAFGTHHLVSEGTAGDGHAISLTVQFPDSLEGYAHLYALSHWMRAQADLSFDLRDVCTSVQNTHSTRPINIPDQTESGYLSEDSAGPRGYDLFATDRNEDVVQFEWVRMQMLGVGKVEALAMQSWITAVHHAIALPDTFGAMIDVNAALRAVYMNVFYSPDAPHKEFSWMLRELLENGQKAYQQRLQFSPALGGSPPILGEVPYGMSQLVGTMSGVTRAILKVVEPENVILPAPIVVFCPDRKIAMKGVSNVGVFVLGALQAMNPVALCLLFHEAGHWFLRHWAQDGAQFGAFQRRLHACGRRAEDTFQKCFVDQPPRTTAYNDSRAKGERFRLFFEDILAHAVWRELGCGGDFTLFQTQFLTGAAMGLRTQLGVEGASEASPLELWGEAIAHLVIQRTLADHNNEISTAIDALLRAENALTPQTGSPLRNAIEEALPYCTAEVENFLARREVSNDKPDITALLGIVAPGWLITLTSLTASASEGDETAVLLADLADIFQELSARAEVLNNLNRSLRVTDSDYRNIRTDVQKGIVPKPPWTVLDDGGYPNNEAFLWIRELLAAATDSFLKGPREGDMAIRRDVRYRFTGAQNRAKANGVYTDFMGGLFRVGREVRTGDLRMQTTVLDALEEIASRVRAGRINRYFRRGRAFHRIAPTSVSTSVRVVVNNRPSMLELVDTSPVGAGFRAKPHDLPKTDDIIHVPSLEGDLVACRVKWVGTPENNPGRFGVVIIADGESPPNSERGPESKTRRAHADLCWVKVEVNP